MSVFDDDTDVRPFLREPERLHELGAYMIERTWDLSSGQDIPLPWGMTLQMIAVSTFNKVKRIIVPGHQVHPELQSVWFKQPNTIKPRKS